MSEDENIEKLLWELGIMGFGIALENKAKTEDKDNAWWNIAEDVGKDMKENPDKYYDLGKWLYGKLQENSD